MDAQIRDRIRGCAVGAAVGDAMGMPLEFGPARSPDRLEREMLPGRLPAGSFTDDTEMALALAESLLASWGLDPADLAQRFVAWYKATPSDVGVHTRHVLSRIAAGESWEQAVAMVQQTAPHSAGNGAVMRCWPVALAWWDDEASLLTASACQSRVTHAHPECIAGSVFVNVVIYHLLRGQPPAQAVNAALAEAALPEPLVAVIAAAPSRTRQELRNSGWVRHTLESAVWGLLTTASFEEAVVQVANLGSDTDTAAAVAGALAGAAYGLAAIPVRWRETLRGEWPVGSGQLWRAADFIALADQLAAGHWQVDRCPPFPAPA